MDTAAEARRPPNHIIETGERILLEGGRPRPPRGRGAVSKSGNGSFALSQGFGVRQRGEVRVKTRTD